MGSETYFALTTMHLLIWTCKIVLYN